MASDHQKLWQVYRETELRAVSPILEQLGFSLDKEQIHIGGERYVSGDKKLVLIGHRLSDKKKVIIKASSDPKMIEEIRAEYSGRQVLAKINFAYHIFFYPQEILFVESGAHTIFITEFIEQEATFTSRPLEEQFFLALKSFEAQEAVQATTYEHASIISRTFGIWDAQQYLNNFDKYSEQILTILSGQEKLKTLLATARDFLGKNSVTIDLYSDFLTHWDFVPHNLRISGNDIYLLDHSSLRFGNKYESWARFINFMTLYNPDLEQALLGYVKDNRGQQEFLSLRLMRVFRLTELIWYYANTLSRASGNLEILNKKRIDLWTNVLESVLSDKKLDEGMMANYRGLRDSLRDEEEKKRQEKLH